MEPPAGSRRTVSCHGMRVSLYLPFVLLCALLMSACASEEEQAQQAQQAREAAQKFKATIVSGRLTTALSSTGGTVRVECPDTEDKIVRLGCEATAEDPVKRLRIKVARTGSRVSTEEYRVVTKFLDKFHFENSLRDSLGTLRVPEQRPRVDGNESVAETSADARPA